MKLAIVSLSKRAKTKKFKTYRVEKLRPTPTFRDVQCNLPFGLYGCSDHGEVLVAVSKEITPLFTLSLTRNSAIPVKPRLLPVPKEMQVDRLLVNANLLKKQIRSIRK
jgi:hypothetical protein